jgi:nucleoside-diphosphate-sugar epimerase
MIDHVVIAGGSGFIGINLAKELIAKKYRVTLLVRTPPQEKVIGK